jgi:hypothetical protein
MIPAATLWESHSITELAKEFFNEQKPTSTRSTR